MASKEHSFLRKILEAMDQLDQRYHEALRPLYEMAGVDLVTSPRDLYFKMVALFRDAVEIKMSVCDEWLYLMELPADFVPETWEDIFTMQEFGRQSQGKGIKIVRPPMVTPAAIAQNWVGVTIPFSPKIQTPLVFETPFFRNQNARSSDRRFFIVSSSEAVSALAAKDQDAAEAITQFKPEWKDENMSLIFDSDACEVVAIQ